MKLLFIALLVVYGCSGGSSKKRPSKVKVEKSADTSEAPTFRLAIKNCDQILRTMERLTGTSRLQAPVSAVYETVKGSCPADASPDSFDGSHIVAINKLALAFCSGYVTKVIKVGAVSGIDVTKAPKIGITDKGLDNLYEDFFKRFYMGPRTGIPDVAQIKASIEPTLKEVRDVATTPATPAASEALMQGACGMVLSSAPVITQ